MEGFREVFRVVVFDVFVDVVAVEVVDTDTSKRICRNVRPGEKGNGRFL